MTKGLFKSVLFSFQVFEDFPVFLFLVSSLILLRLEYTHWRTDFSSFKYVEACFMAQTMVCLCLCSVDP